MNFSDLNIDKSWTLFLDRDGVINKRLPGAYVQELDQFEFIEGVPRAVELLSSVFGVVVVVTNQQGIGKGLMTDKDLGIVHKHMHDELSKVGGRIDKVYHSPFLESSGHYTRKPGIGMGLKAKKDFQNIKFTKSVMVGDSLSDMIFGKRLKMRTVFIGDMAVARKHSEWIDFVYPDLITFAHLFKLNNPKE